MNLDTLLQRLKDIGVDIKEQKDSGPGRTLILECALPFPFKRQHVWYPLILDDGQTTVPEDEVLAILRHLWHLSEAPDFVPDVDEDE